MGLLIKKLLLGLSLLVVLLVISGLVGLLILRHSVGVYADYWRQKANEPGQFTYVVLGDSVAQAIGASKPEKGYVGQIASRIEQQTGRKVRIINLSVTGAKVSDLLRTQLSELAKYEPDLVTVEIGANNMRNYDSATFRKEYELFLQALPPGRSVVSTMPYFGTRPSINQYAQDANRTITQLAEGYNVPVVDIYQPLKNRQSPFIYAADFFHPNDRGYDIWYDAFWPAVDRLVKEDFAND